VAPQTERKQTKTLTSKSTHNQSSASISIQESEGLARISRLPINLRTNSVDAQSFFTAAPTADLPPLKATSSRYKIEVNHDLASERNGGRLGNLPLKKNQGVN